MRPLSVSVLLTELHTAMSPSRSMCESVLPITSPEMSATLQAARFVAAQCGSADEPSTSSSGQVQLTNSNGPITGLATVATALARSGAPSLLGEGEAQQAQVSFSM